MNEAIERLGDELVSTLFDQEPLEAALLGLDDGSDGLADLSRDAESEAAQSYRSLAEAADALAASLDRSGAALQESDRLALDLVRLTGAARARSADLPLLELTITDFQTAPLSALFTVLPQLPLGSTVRRQQYLDRLAALPAYLEQAAQRHREGLASGRTATDRGIRSAIAQIDQVMADPEVSGLRRHDDREVDGEFLSSQQQLIDDAVLPAILAFRSFLEDEVLGSGRSDEQPGLCWLPDGEAMYNTLVATSTSTDRTAEDLHAAGLAIIEEVNLEFATVGDRLWGISDVPAIHERLRTDPSLRFSSADEIVDAAITAVRRAEEAAPGWFGLVTSTPCAVEPIPEALATSAPTAYYFAGALDGSRVGTYFVNTTSPDQRFRHMSEDIAFHEAVPGHHFQLTIAQELSDTHLAQRIFTDVATAEGWGLYAERLADEMDLYSGDLDRLGMLSADAWRAARLVVDTGLHAFGWSRQAAIDWMFSHVPLSALEVEAEVDRYIAMPGQALSYMVGRMAIEACRREATDELGAAFDVRRFHDLVLTSGPVPIPALEAAVRRWIASQRPAS